MEYKKATAEDAEHFLTLRREFTRDMHPEFDEETLARATGGVERFFRDHIDKNISVYFAFDGGEAVATALLEIHEGLPKPVCPKGLTGTVLNVYTRPGYRRRGIAKTLMGLIMREAGERGLEFLELEATEMGRPLYLALGFTERKVRFTPMRWTPENK